MKRGPTGSRPAAGRPPGPDKGLQALSRCRGGQADFGPTSGQPPAVAPALSPRGAVDPRSRTRPVTLRKRLALTSPTRRCAPRTTCQTTPGPKVCSAGTAVYLDLMAFSSALNWSSAPVAPWVNEVRLLRGSYVAPMDTECDGLGKQQGGRT